jgi:uncharacterized protein YcgL (UPF0745 family)
MICDIYRSDTKTGLYIYLAKGKKIADLPEVLVNKFGKYTEVMELDLGKRNCLANEDINIVKANLQELGYHLQIPRSIVKDIVNYQK